MGAWKRSERRRNFGTSFGLVVITPPPCDPHHHDLDDKAEMGHFDVEYRPAATTVH
ncbi:MAG: hypothetical protein OXK20_05350 [Deltaproteobacteria bacterium]|nr:hypothetical protein [Deltaproteobacteria bacterium]